MIQIFNDKSSQQFQPYPMFLLSAGRGNVKKEWPVIVRLYENKIRRIDNAGILNHKAGCIFL